MPARTNYQPYTMTATDAAEQVTTINVSSLAAGASSDWIYPGAALSMFWVNKATTPGSAEQIYVQIRGAAGGATATQYAILKDDAPGSPATDGHASTLTSMTAGQLPGSMIPHEFRLLNNGATVANVTLYIKY